LLQRSVILTSPPGIVKQSLNSGPAALTKLVDHLQGFHIPNVHWEASLHTGCLSRSPDQDVL